MTSTIDRTTDVTCAKEKDVLVLNMMVSAPVGSMEKCQSSWDQAVYLSAGSLVHISLSAGHLQTQKCRVQTEKKLHPVALFLP